MSEVDWRRRWKPTLQAKSWQGLAVTSDESYSIKSIFTDNSYEVLVTDFTSVWHESLETDDIKKRTKKLNPNVEAPLSKLLDHVRENIETKKKGTEYTVAFKQLDDSDDQKLLLTVNTQLAGLPFVWKFNGSPANKDLVADHLTLPLLGMVGELKRRQTELNKLLKNKDKEIEDLKSQGIRVSRKHLETTPFDETAFKNNMVVSQGFEEQVKYLGQTTFDDGGQELYRDIMMKHAWLHRNLNEAADEGETMEDEESVATGGTAGGRGQSWANRLPPSLVQTTGSLSPKKSPGRSPARSPAKSPGGATQSAGVSPVKDTEILRRQALEKRLADEEGKKEQKKKKKKIKF